MIDAVKSVPTHYADIPAGYWACACVRRDKEGNLKAIKMHPAHHKSCRVCKAKKPPSEDQL